jgi:hypothetical protein
MVDNSPTATGFEYNFVTGSSSQVSAFRVDLNFSLISGGTGVTNLTFGAGEFSSDSSLKFSLAARRYFNIELYSDSQFNVNSGAGPDDNDNVFGAGSNLLTVFVNDYNSQDLLYVRPDTSLTGTLSPNSIAVYHNSIFIHQTLLDISDTNSAGTTIGTSENNFGRIGFYSVSGVIGIDYNFDNLLVTQIPEPSSVALVAAGCGLVLLRSTRKVRRNTNYPESTSESHKDEPVPPSRSYGRGRRSRSLQGFQRVIWRDDCCLPCVALCAKEGVVQKIPLDTFIW